LVADYCSVHPSLLRCEEALNKIRRNTSVQEPAAASPFPEGHTPKVPSSKNVVEPLEPPHIPESSETDTSEHEFSGKLEKFGRRKHFKLLCNRIFYSHQGILFQVAYNFSFFLLTAVLLVLELFHISDWTEQGTPLWYLMTDALMAVLLIAEVVLRCMDVEWSREKYFSRNMNIVDFALVILFVFVAFLSLEEYHWHKTQSVPENIALLIIRLGRGLLRMTRLVASLKEATTLLHYSDAFAGPPVADPHTEAQV